MFDEYHVAYARHLGVAEPALVEASASLDELWKRGGLVRVPPVTRGEADTAGFALWVCRVGAVGSSAGWPSSVRSLALAAVVSGQASSLADCLDSVAMAWPLAASRARQSSIGRRRMVVTGKRRECGRHVPTSHYSVDARRARKVAMLQSSRHCAAIDRRLRACQWPPPTRLPSPHPPCAAR